MNGKPAKRIVSRKGKKGWRFRLVNPATKKRTWRTFWFSEYREAESARNAWLEGQERRKRGMADNSGWEVSFLTAVQKFLQEAPITSDARREHLRVILERNELRLQTLADLGAKGRLTAQCVQMIRRRSDQYVRKQIQQPLKQIAAWAASIDLLPYNPLASWKLIPRTSEPRRRLAFSQTEIRQVLEAAQTYDERFERRFPTTLIFRALLITGNRPGAVLRAKVCDLREGRIVLPAGNGKKRNGMATVPEPFEAELRAQLIERGNPGSNEPLLVSPDGSAVDAPNISNEFRRALVLAAVRLHWPKDPTEVDEFAVADAIYCGKVRGFDGAPPRDKEKLAKRKRIVESVTAIVERIKPDVVRWMEGRDMYALRKTHISWARRLLNNIDSVKAQVGHGPQDIEERHYLDLRFVNARESSLAVWSVLNGERTMDVNAFGDSFYTTPKGGVSGSMDYRTDYERKNPKKELGSTALPGSQSIEDKGLKNGSPCWIRTSDQGIMSEENTNPPISATDPISPFYEGEMKIYGLLTSADDRLNPPINGLQNGLRSEDPADSLGELSSCPMCEQQSKDLATIVEAWPRIPHHVRKAMLILASGAKSP
jgi:integrase